MALELSPDRIDLLENAFSQPDLSLNPLTKYFAGIFDEDNEGFKNNVSIEKFDELPIPDKSQLGNGNDNDEFETELKFVHTFINSVNVFLSDQRNSMKKSIKQMNDKLNTTPSISKISSIISWSHSYNEYISSEPIFNSKFQPNIKLKTLESKEVEFTINKLSKKIIKNEINLGLTNPKYEKERLKQINKWLYNQVSKISNDMICKFNHKSLLRLAYASIVLILKKAYNNGINVSRKECLKLIDLSIKSSKEKKSLVFLPCHKSHVDYIIMHLLCVRLGICLPTVVAGENLNVDIFGPILQDIGAMFIRRGIDKSSTNDEEKSNDEQLYESLLYSYITQVLSQGLNFEMFIEGTRSRIGKLLPPKFGILRIIIDAILTEKVSDLYIIPISTQYDKVVESSDYTSQLLGGDKPKENFLSIFQTGLEAISGKWSLGKVDVRISDGWSLKECLYKELELDLNKSSLKSLEIGLYKNSKSRKYTKMISSIGYKILNEINDISVITPTSIVGTVLLTHLTSNGRVAGRGDRGIGYNDLLNDVKWLVIRIKLAGGCIDSQFDSIYNELIDDDIDVHSIIQLKLIVSEALKVLGPKLIKAVLPQGYEIAMKNDKSKSYSGYTLNTFLSDYSSIESGSNSSTNSSTNLNLNSNSNSNSKINDFKKIERDEFDTIYEPIYCVLDPFQLSYYRNMMIHLFISEAIVCISFNSLRLINGKIKIKISELEIQVQFLSKLLSKEFIFSPQGLTTNLELTLLNLEKQNIFILERNKEGNDDDVLVSINDNKESYKHFLFYCATTWPFIEGYWLTILSISTILSKIYQVYPTNESETQTTNSNSKNENLNCMDINEFINITQTLGKTLYHEGKIEYYESVNKELIKNSINYFITIKILKREKNKIFIIKDLNDILNFRKNIANFKNFNKFHRYRLKSLF